MPCCPSNIIPFFNEPVTTFMYSDSLKAAYGLEPKISVYYKDPVKSGFYTINSLMGTEVKLNLTTNLLSVDHGGVFSGYIKLE